MNQMNERQEKAWPVVVAEAQRYVPAGTLPLDTDSDQWHIRWLESEDGEQAFDAYWWDGEYLVAIFMDVSGYHDVTVARTVWLHSTPTDDYECSCPWCESLYLDGSEVGAS